MALDLAYTSRHLASRLGTTMMAVGGIALVVAVFAATLMLSQGLKQTLAATGLNENVIVVRTGSQNEIQSGVNREHAAIIAAQPEVARDAEGKELITNDVVVLISLKKKANNQPSNVTIRGISTQGLAVRSQVKIVQGRRPTAGTQEVMLGQAIFDRFIGTELGKSLRLVGTDWTIVGVFDAGTSGFNSEIWGDSDILMPAFRRERFSSVTFRLRSDSDFETVQARLEADRRLSVTLKREQQFYAEQSRSLAKFIMYIGIFVSVIFSLGAIIGGMITMYSAVANRVREIGVLQAIGFSRWNVLAAFMRESIMLSILGGVLGIVAASLLGFLTVSTTNFMTFSEVAFGFSLTPKIIAYSLIFATVMGIIGGLLPAIKVARLRIVEALRAI